MRWAAPAASFARIAFATCALAACSPAAGDEDAVEEGELALGSAPLEASDFERGLSKSFIASTHALPESRFAAKWSASRAGPALMFFRAYPAAFHADFATNLAASARAKIPSAVGICVGDAHPDNFGFLRLGRRVLYAYNDLDDSGYCPVALDALRYVAAVSLFFDDAELTTHAARRYVKVVSGERTAREAQDDIGKIREDAPDFARRRTEKLEDLARDDALILGEGMTAVSAAQRSSLASALGALPNVTVLDAAKVERETGGSAGLDRYWALVQRGSVRTVLELKERAKPGVEHGLSARAIPDRDRLPLLKREIWASDITDDYVQTSAWGKTFLVRDRLAKASLDALELSKTQREQVVEAQAAILGLLHKKALTVRDQESRDALERWLVKSAKVIADRWKAAQR